MTTDPNFSVPGTKERAHSKKPAFGMAWRTTAWTTVSAMGADARTSITTVGCDVFSSILLGQIWALFRKTSRQVFPLHLAPAGEMVQLAIPFRLGPSSVDYNDDGWNGTSSSARTATWTTLSPETPAHMTNHV